MEKLKAFFNKTFWQSVAAAIFFYFVIEKFGIVSKSIIEFFIKMSSRFSDKYYRMLTNDDQANYEELILIFLLYIIVLIIIVLLNAMLNKGLASRREFTSVFLLARKVYNIILLGSLFIFVILMVILPLTMSINTDRHKFQKNATILLPYIGQDEVNKLKSSWELIKTSEDFNKIMTQVEKYKMEYLIKE